MKVLVVGGGGREHALVSKINQSPYIEEIYCAPGNGGICQNAECVDIDENDFKKLIQFAEMNAIDLTVVGPEIPLSLGIVDQFYSAGLTIFGPTKRAAELEGSKEFAKKFMDKYHIPTARFRIFEKAKEAIQYIHEINPPFVVKANGLAAGKGVIICQTRIEGFDAVERIMKKKEFGKAGKKLIIEEYLEGEEVSVLAISDGKRLSVLPPAQDHKAVFEGDTGPNTGGMGAYAPAPLVTDRMMQTIEKEILYPTIEGMKREGRPYQGVLYAGLMITKGEPKVLEYNCRFGDPETQAVLPLLKTDIVDLMLESAEGRLKAVPVELYNKVAVCVIMASGGYPGKYKKDKVIFGLDRVPRNTMVFHAGTKQKKGKLLTSGGRVLGVTAMDETISFAVDKVYNALSKITFDGAYYRRDIAHRAYKR